MGFGPLASVGPVSLGPGAAEKSSLEIPRVVVCVDPLQSLLQRKLILHLLADQAQVGAPPHCDLNALHAGALAAHEYESSASDGQK